MFYMAPFSQRLVRLNMVTESLFASIAGTLNKLALTDQWGSLELPWPSMLANWKLFLRWCDTRTVRHQ